jgi:DNA (cytosine-5)-methyltransferase 1
VEQHLTAIDLFAGAGGATAGLRAAGFSVRAAVEWDEDAAASYRLNHPTTPLLQRDIRDVTADEVLRTARVPKGQLSLLQACPPCQTWSSLGRRRADDPRNDLVTLVSTFIRGIRPRTFVLENVPGLLADQRLTMLVLDAQILGYRVATYSVDAVDFGVPQKRKRLIVLGVRGRRSRALPKSLAELLPVDFDQSHHTVAEAFASIQSNADDTLQRSRELTPLIRRRISSIPVGGDRRDLPEDLQLACHRSLVRRSATASYGRMKADAPAPTLTTRCTTPACGAYIHPCEDRGITLREAATLQSFPADYTFRGGYGSIERQIGNAIPVRLAEGVARAAITLAEPRVHTHLPRTVPGLAP